MGEKPNRTLESPEKLSFQEKLARHKRIADQGQPKRPSSAKEAYFETSHSDVQDDTNVNSSHEGSDCISNHNQAIDSINAQAVSHTVST